ncbi:hypothetical protein [Xanthomonas fragariae]|uniref:hypothetical protein n=1 Tax=Xanthomonas fragariae TaxID=48664 RepID=UPI001ABE17ED|nr:hypothetical protein [Xanthomonas fragariae]UKR52589.1 hypothetical protein K4A87_19300 [Xanthomonas fragariae]
MKTKMVASALAFAAFFNAHAADHAPLLDQGNDVDQMLALQEDVELANAPVNSQEKLISYLSANPSSVFFKLPASAQESFKSSLVFTDKGLASYYYESLTKYLTTKQIYQLLSLFGAQKTISFIPGITASNPMEKNIIVSESPYTPTPRSGNICIINGSSSQCRPEYGSMCSRACQ